MILLGFKNLPVNQVFFDQRPRVDSDAALVRPAKEQLERPRKHHAFNRNILLLELHHEILKTILVNDQIMFGRGPHKQIFFIVKLIVYKAIK